MAQSLTGTAPVALVSDSSAVEHLALRLTIRTGMQSALIVRKDALVVGRNMRVAVITGCHIQFASSFSTPSYTIIVFSCRTRMVCRSVLVPSTGSRPGGWRPRCLLGAGVVYFLFAVALYNLWVLTNLLVTPRRAFLGQIPYGYRLSRRLTRAISSSQYAPQYWQD